MSGEFQTVKQLCRRYAELRKIEQTLSRQITQLKQDKHDMEKELMDLEGSICSDVKFPTAYTFGTQAIVILPPSGSRIHAIIEFTNLVDGEK